MPHMLIQCIGENTVVKVADSTCCVVHYTHIHTHREPVPSSGPCSGRLLFTVVIASRSSSGLIRVDTSWQKAMLLQLSTAQAKKPCRLVQGKC